MTSGSNPNSQFSTQPKLNPGVQIRNDIQDYDYQREVQDLHNLIDNIVSNGNLDYAKSLNGIISNDLQQHESTHIPMSLRKFFPNVNIESEINATADIIKELMESGYCTDANLYNILCDRFKVLTGIDINQYITKTKLSNTDWENVNHFNEFADAVLAKMQHDYANDPELQYPPLEMAYYSAHVYGDNPGYDGLCNPLRDVNIIPNVNERQSAQKILDFLSSNNVPSTFKDSGLNSLLESGFTADFYYDKDADKYILSFQGTQNLTDLIQDEAYLATGISQQHSLASMLADEIILSGIPIEKLTITGHSLGGGLAMLTGLKTGAETYAYNPLHISAKCAEAYGLDTSNDAKIHIYEIEGENIVRSAETIEAVTNPEYIFQGKLDIGEVTTVAKPESSVINHGITQLIKAIEFNGGEKTSNFIQGKNMLQAVKNLRTSKTYQARTTSIMIKTGPETEGITVGSSSRSDFRSR